MVQFGIVALRFMGMKLVSGFLCAICLASPSAFADEAPDTVKPREVRKVFADGKHNAFTALAKFQDQYWLAFRTGKDHNSKDGDIVVLRSEDAKTWTEALRQSAGGDDRDPQVLVAGKRLILYDFVEDAKDSRTYASFTEDGKTWTKPQSAYEPPFLIWQPCAFKGKYYSGAHKIDNKSAGKNRAVHLIVSDDGLDWKKISTIRAGSWESETTIHFDAKGGLTAFLRQKYGSPQPQILESAPPYTEWKSRNPNVPHFSGHSAHTFNGVDYVISRTMDYASKKIGCTIYTYAGGKLHPYCVLPAGGDCAYSGAVQSGEDMLVSYYSSHEGPTNIYLAVVPLKK